MQPTNGALMRVGIELGERRYDIVIGEGLLDDRLAFDELARSTSAAIVSNTTVAPLYSSRLARVLAPFHQEVLLIELPDGESHKDWASLSLIFEALLAARADRRTVIYALGGGVVGDIAGFAAACYMRGVPYVQVPTTLLAQVDSSVGGKTAINHRLGKNMIGAFHQPIRVVADLDTLDTLPAREIAAGLAEIIKYGPIADHDFLDWIEVNIDAISGARTSRNWRTPVRRSCEIKARVVGSGRARVRAARDSQLRSYIRARHRSGRWVWQVAAWRGGRDAGW